MVNQKFWKNKKVLVTGHTGFKGSWLSLWLQDMGANVVGYALTPPTTPNLFNLAKVGEKMISINADVRDLDHLRKVIEEHKPEIIMHLAAQPIVIVSYKDPLLTYSTNIMGTANLLEASRNKKYIKAIVCITSDKCYENKSLIRGYRESDMLGGNDPYSSSKACAELIIASYRNSFFKKSSEVCIPIASARAGNVIGGGDWAKNRLIPDIIRAFIDNQPVLIRNPKATRPWQHVLEPLSGYLTLAERLYSDGEFAEAWNFGPDTKEAKPVSYIVDRLAKRWGGSASWEGDLNNHPHEDMYLSLDNSKAKRLLGWEPKLSLAKTLDWVTDWSKTYKDRGDVREKTINQIHKFQNLKNRHVKV